MLFLIFFFLFIVSYREKKREREREELWKKLHDLESSRSNNKVLKPESNSDSTHQQNNSSSINNTMSGTGPSPLLSTTASSINSGMGGTPSPYNIKKEIVLPKEE